MCDTGFCDSMRERVRRRGRVGASQYCREQDAACHASLGQRLQPCAAADGPSLMVDADFGNENPVSGPWRQQGALDRA